MKAGILLVPRDLETKIGLLFDREGKCDQPRLALHLDEKLQNLVNNSIISSICLILGIGNCALGLPAPN